MLNREKHFKNNILIGEYITDRFIDLYISSSMKIEDIMMKLNDEISRYSPNIMISNAFSIAIVEMILSKIKIYFFGEISVYKGSFNSISKILDEPHVKSQNNYIKIFEKDNLFDTKSDYYFICTPFEEEEEVLKKIKRIIFENMEKKSKEIMKIIYKHLIKLNLSDENIIMVLIK